MKLWDGTPIKHFVFKAYWWMALLFGVLLVLILTSDTSDTSDARRVDWEVLIPGVAAILSFVYFVNRQKLEELKVFKELFSEFNGRYDRLNESLNDILGAEPTKELTPEKRDTLNDYFNLCGEEFLYFDEGYIYPPVWEAWYNGMNIFCAEPRVREMWIQESKSDSYYGLQID